MNKLEVLQSLEVEGNIVKMTKQQLDRKVYLEVKKALELIGGKWKGGATWGFIFKQDPTELLAELQGGGSRNLKKEYQYFGTPTELADRLVRLAHIYGDVPILEPSAGQGNIVESILRAAPIAEVHCIELMELNFKILRDKFPANVKMLQGDFMEYKNTKHKFGRIIANPPFTKNQDIDHIMRMYEVLESGGRMVSCASTSWSFGSQKKQVAFRDWLYDLRAEIIDLPEGTFKESGTMIPAKIIIIDKI